MTKIFREDLDRALTFFEGLIIASVKAVIEKNEDDLKALGVALEVPTSPFPRFLKDEADKQHGAQYEARRNSPCVMECNPASS